MIYIYQFTNQYAFQFILYLGIIFDNSPFLECGGLLRYIFEAEVSGAVFLWKDLECGGEKFRID